MNICYFSDFYVDLMLIKLTKTNEEIQFLKILKKKNLQLRTAFPGLVLKRQSGQQVVLTGNIS
jgi:hypothetical protein